MRSGLIISAVGHGTAALLAVLLAGAGPFDSVATEAIAVEIVSPSEVPPDQPDGPAAEPGSPKEPTPEFNPQFDLALTPQPLSAPAPPSPAAKPVQQASGPRAREPQSARQPAAPAAAAPQATARPSTPPPPPVQPAMPVQMQPPAAPETDKQPYQPTNVADLFGMPLALPDGRLGGGFDGPAPEAAKIERSSADAFRAHLKTCAMLPAGVSPTEKIALVLRVKLKADGTLIGQPTLIEGSASAKGPAILQSLLGGLQKCQPFDMLPANKYQEWKSIDVRFTPNDMGQG
jgi:hypothetical protein